MSNLTSFLGAAFLEGGRAAGRARLERRDEERLKQQRELELMNMALRQEQLQMSKRQQQLGEEDRVRQRAQELLAAAGPNGVLSEEAAQEVEGAGLGFRLGPAQEGTATTIPWSGAPVEPGPQFQQPGRPVLPTAADQITLDAAAEKGRERDNARLAQQALSHPGFAKLAPEVQQRLWQQAGQTGVPYTVSDTAADAEHRRRMEELALQGRNSIAAAGARTPTTFTPTAHANLVGKLRKQYLTETEAARTLDTQVAQMESAFDEIQRTGRLNATTQTIIMSFNKILDPGSVVRESEYARSPEGQGLADRIQGIIPRITQGGPGLTPQALEEFLTLSRQFVAQARRGAAASRQVIEDTADYYQLPKELIVGQPPQVAPPSGGSSPNPADPLGIRRP